MNRYGVFPKEYNVFCTQSYSGFLGHLGIESVCSTIYHCHYGINCTFMFVMQVSFSGETIQNICVYVCIIAIKSYIIDFHLFCFLFCLYLCSHLICIYNSSISIVPEYSGRLVYMWELQVLSLIADCVWIFQKLPLFTHQRNGYP